MKKRIIGFFLLTFILLSAVSFASCSGSGPKEGTVTRMTVDINPSVEFMIDDQNKVISVTALNDDGGILIVGEELVGKTPEEAVSVMVKLASDTGYLIKGNVEASENTVKISVSGDSKYAEQLASDVTAKINDTLKQLDINGSVEKAEALKIDALRQLALSTSLYTENEINAMDEDDLYKVISVGRIETALLLTEEMRSAYFSAKEYKISFAEREETARIIKELGGLYNVTHGAYKAALDVYSTAIAELDDFRYEMLVSPESDYQVALGKLREAKVELLKQKSYTASLEVNGEEYASATVTLQMSEENYNKMLLAFEKVGSDINSSLEALISTLKEAESKLVELEGTLFDENIEAKLKENATELEATLNSAKDGFFAEFESAHAEDITNVKESLLAKKKQLQSEINANE